MTIIARFSFDVPFGKKQQLFELMTKWEKLGTDLGLTKPEVLVGSIGTPESRVELQHRFDSLAALEGFFTKVAKEPRMADYQRDMAPFIVPASHRWEILRVQQV